MGNKTKSSSMFSDKYSPFERTWRTG